MTFVGFWPAREHGLVKQAVLTDQGAIESQTRKLLRETAYEYSGEGWVMRVANDYLCLLHLLDLEPQLQAQRDRRGDDDYVPGYFGVSKPVWQAYVQALNAWYFTLHAAAHTGRAQYFLHDFSEIRGEWDCDRIVFGASGIPKKHASFGRPRGPWLDRFGKQLHDRPPRYRSIDECLFADAAAYFSQLFDCSRLDLGALGTKLLTEHRMGNYRTVVALAWFEVEAWINDQMALAGYPTTFVTKKGDTKFRWVSEMIDDFTPGSSVGRLQERLHALRDIRNEVAHDNRSATVTESKAAIKMFQEVLRSRTGLELRLDLHGPPVSSIA